MKGGGAIMIAIQRILCPTDLTSESDEALRYAVGAVIRLKRETFRSLLQGNRNESQQ